MCKQMFSVILICFCILFTNPGSVSKSFGVELKQTSQGKLEPEAQYGIDRLKVALKTPDKSVDGKDKNPNTEVILYGTLKESKVIQQLVKEGKLKLKDAAESLAVKRLKIDGRKTIVFAGADATGLMYALLDLVDALEHSTTPANTLDTYADISESPKNGMRRMRVLMHHAANEHDWYHSKEYWDWYIGMLSTNRFNGLNLVYSHQTPYMAPMYAWHLKIDEFPDVRPRGVSDEQREENLEVMRYIAKLCDERGIELTIGVWQHLPWMRSYLKTRPNQEVLVDGLNGKNVGRYSYLAMKKLLKECPGIARIQLRPNDESGIHSSEQTSFYRDNVMRAIKESPRNVKLDLRTVGVQESTIQAERDADLDVRTSVKFNGEFLGMPYTTREVVTRGYSYDRYFEKPLKNPVYNEVWMLGSHRVLLWGSEGYARQFGMNASYGPSVGFETDGPMAQKGYQQPTSPAWRFFKHKDDEYFDHEIERFWAFFRASGRFTYNPNTPHEVWMRPFRKRFGAAAEPMAKAYESASEVIGLIVWSHVKDVNMYTWPEITMGGLIPFFNDLRGIDKGIFPSIDDQVKQELAGIATGQPGPMKLADMFENIATRTEKALEEARQKVGNPDKEFRATENDFRILAYLARYYAHRQREGYLISKFYRTNDASLLPTAIKESDLAVSIWKKLAAIGDKQYYGKMQTGPVENGHWKDRTFLAEINPEIVREAQTLLQQHGIFDMGFDFGRPSMTQGKIVFQSYKRANDYDRVERFIGVDPGRLYDPRAGFGFLQNKDLKYTRSPMVLYENLTGQEPTPNHNKPLNMLQGDFVRSKQPIGFRMDLPMDAFRFTFVFSDQSSKPTDHGPFYVARSKQSGANRRGSIRVGANKSVVYQTNRNIRGSWYPFVEYWINPSKPGSEAILSALTVHRNAPNMGHAPVYQVTPNEACKLSVTITMPPQKVGKKQKLSAAPGNRLGNAVLRYRTNPSQGFKTLSLTTKDGFVYSTTIPSEDIQGRWLEYRFEAEDKKGRTVSFPSSGNEKSLRARISADSTPPEIIHHPKTTWKVSVPMPIEVTAKDADGVSVVRAYFRPMNQSLPFESILLDRKGDKFVGVIPGGTFQKQWDLVYYLEAVDEARNGCYFPDWKKTTPFITVVTEK